MDYLLSCFSIGVIVMNPATQPLLTLMRHGQVKLPTGVCFGSLCALICHLQDQSIDRFFDHTVPFPVLTFV
jgi:hypothetical protein